MPAHLSCCRFDHCMTFMQQASPQHPIYNSRRVGLAYQEVQNLRVPRSRPHGIPGHRAVTSYFTQPRAKRECFHFLCIHGRSCIQEWGSDLRKGGELNAFSYTPNDLTINQFKERLHRHLPSPNCLFKTVLQDSK